MQITKEQFKAEVGHINNLINSHFRHFETPLKKMMNDGIVNIDEYYSSEIKIMWILKEPYDSNENGMSGGWSMTDALDKDELGKRRDSKTWNNIILASFGILNGFERVKKIKESYNYDEVRSVLKKIVFINVKKIPGATTTANSTLIKAYNENKGILLNQISTYRPNIIIGGKTLHLFKGDLKIEEKNQLDSGHFFLENQLFINTLHPGQRKLSSEVYVNKIIERAEQWKEIYSK